MKDKKYLESLENFAKQILQPMKDLPFKIVIESLYGSKVLNFDLKEKNNKSLLENLVKIANLAGKNANKKGIKSKRVNEVGNYIEPYVKEALESLGYEVIKQNTKSGKSKSTGYPDLQFIDAFGRYCYLECKTFNIKSINTTQRSFYLSPSNDPKVNKDGFHFVLSFEVAVDKLQIYKCKSYKILSIDNLSCDIKHEFNSDNKRLYHKDLIIAEGKL
jgi:hypothetical protein